MSGSSTGAIIGVAIAAPALIVAGAVKGTVAVVKGAVWAAREIEKMHQAYQEKRQFELNSANQAINTYNASLNRIFSEQTKAEREMFRTACERLEAQARSVNADVLRERSAAGCAALKETARSAEEEMLRSITRQGEQLRKTARIKYAEQKQILEDELAELSRLELETAQRSQKTEAVHSTAESWLRQAGDALDSLEQHDPSGLITKEINTQRETLQSAVDAHNNGINETALADAQMIISEAAALEWKLAELENKAFEKAVKARIMLGMTLQHLEEERFIDYEDPDSGRAYHLDLDRFTGGGFTELEAKIRQSMEPLENSGSVTAAELDRITAEAGSYRTKCDELGQCGISAAASYFDRMHALTAIAEGLKHGNNYRLAWTAAVDDDVTKPIVINLQNVLSGDSMSISLAGSSADNGFEINVDNFAAEDSQIDEGYRAGIYEEIVRLLEQAMPGSTASLNCCRETAHMNSANTANATLAGVRKRNARRNRANN